MVRHDIAFELTPQDGERIRWYLEDYLQFEADPAPLIARDVEALMAACMRRRTVSQPGWTRNSAIGRSFHKVSAARSATGWTITRRLLTGSREAALAHAKGDKIEAACKRGDALAKRRKLMEAWAQHCAGTWVWEEEDADDNV
jgi:hypothetical protein